MPLIGTIKGVVAQFLTYYNTKNTVSIGNYELTEKGRELLLSPSIPMISPDWPYSNMFLIWPQVASSLAKA